MVWKSGHIGVYVGNGYTVELKGFNYDCQRNRLSAGSWTKWGRLPASMIAYGGETGENEETEKNVLSKGDCGADVTAMQEALLKWAPKCLPKYGADGSFGSETEKAVKAFQTAVGLLVTGVCDAATGEALAARAGEDCPAALQAVVITGNTVNVREAPGTSGKILGVVRKGARLSWQGEKRAVNGRDWYLVGYGDGHGWVSSKYAEVIA